MFRGQEVFIHLMKTLGKKRNGTSQFALCLSCSKKFVVRGTRQENFCGQAKKWTRKKSLLLSSNFMQAPPTTNTQPLQNEQVRSDDLLIWSNIDNSYFIDKLAFFSFLFSELDRVLLGSGSIAYTD